MVAINETTEQEADAKRMAEIADGAYESVSKPQLVALLELARKNNAVLRSMALKDGCPYAFNKLLFAQLASQLAMLGALCSEDELDYAGLVPFMAALLEDRVMEDE